MINPQSTISHTEKQKHHFEFWVDYKKNHLDAASMMRFHTNLRLEHFFLPTDRILMPHPQDENRSNCIVSMSIIYLDSCFWIVCIVKLKAKSDTHFHRLADIRTTPPNVADMEA